MVMSTMVGDLGIMFVDYEEIMKVVARLQKEGGASWASMVTSECAHTCNVLCCFMLAQIWHNMRGPVTQLHVHITRICFALFNKYDLVKKQTGNILFGYNFILKIKDLGEQMKEGENILYSRIVVASSMYVFILL
ncbi:hypothetical protein ACJX0J_009010 [Zea mays]